MNRWAVITLIIFYWEGVAASCEHFDFSMMSDEAVEQLHETRYNAADFAEVLCTLDALQGRVDDMIIYFHKSIAYFNLGCDVKFSRSLDNYFSFGAESVAAYADFILQIGVADVDNSVIFSIFQKYLLNM
ncbi:MAG: hypothetical protein LAT61_12520 [Alcanivorax sp.]|nr:hypothetical protein [Alcanivorax sp.]